MLLYSSVFKLEHNVSNTKKKSELKPAEFKKDDSLNEKLKSLFFSLKHPY
jgi:hypothetical protein